MSQEGIPQGRMVQEPDPYHPLEELQGRAVAQTGNKGRHGQIYFHFSASRQPKRTFKTRTMLSSTDGDRESR